MPDPGDPYNLRRFLVAQGEVYDQVLAELRAGAKRTHWMWFIFPQFAGLGASAMAQRYALQSRAEALAYHAHPVLGARLRACTRLVLDSGRRIGQIFAHPDDLKFHSCMTLFAAVAPEEPLYREVLDRCFDGREDARTLQMLR